MCAVGQNPAATWVGLSLPGLVGAVPPPRSEISCSWGPAPLGVSLLAGAPGPLGSVSRLGPGPARLVARGAPAPARSSVCRVAPVPPPESRCSRALIGPARVLVASRVPPLSESVAFRGPRPRSEDGAGVCCAAAPGPARKTGAVWVVRTLLRLNRHARAIADSLRRKHGLLRAPLVAHGFFATRITHADSPLAAGGNDVNPAPASYDLPEPTSRIADSRTRDDRAAEAGIPSPQRALTWTHRPVRVHTLQSGGYAKAAPHDAASYRTQSNGRRKATSPDPIADCPRRGPARQRRVRTTSRARRLEHGRHCLFYWVLVLTLCSPTRVRGNDRGERFVRHHDESRRPPRRRSLRGRASRAPKVVDERRPTEGSVSSASPLSPRSAPAALHLVDEQRYDESSHPRNHDWQPILERRQGADFTSYIGGDRMTPASTACYARDELCMGPMTGPAPLPCIPSHSSFSYAEHSILPRFTLHAPARGLRRRLWPSPRWPTVGSGPSTGSPTVLVLVLAAFFVFSFSWPRVAVLVLAAYSFSSLRFGAVA